MLPALLPLVTLAWTAHVTPPLAAARTARAVSPLMEYGDAFYQSAPPGSLPDDVYEVTLRKPLGIMFEEDGPIVGKSGVSCIGLVEGGSADKDGTVKEGDKLVGVTAVRFVGSKWERDMFDTRKWDFDTVVDAIGSNEEKFECYDVVLQFQRTKGEAKSETV